MSFVTGWGSISGRCPRVKPVRRGLLNTGEFLVCGGLRNERPGFFALGRIFHGIRRNGGRAGSFPGLGNLEGGSMSEPITSAQAFWMWVTLGSTVAGCVFGQIVSQRMLLRYQDREQKKLLAYLKARRAGEMPLLQPAKADVDHVAELGEKRRPFFVNFFAEMGVFFREFLFELKLMVQEAFLIIKLLVQKLLLKSVVNNDAEKGAGDKANNADVGTFEKGLNAHEADASRAKLGVQGGTR